MMRAASARASSDLPHVNFKYREGEEKKVLRGPS